MPQLAEIHLGRYDQPRRRLSYNWFLSNRLKYINAMQRQVELITAVGDTLDKMHKYADSAGWELGTMGTTREKSIVNIHKRGQ